MAMGISAHTLALRCTDRQCAFLTPMHTLFVVLLIVVVVGCANEEDRIPTVVFAGWGNPYEVQLAHDIIDDFQLEAPGFNVRFLHIPYDYDSVLLTMMAGVRAPDIFYIGPHMLDSLVSKRVLYDITERIEKSDRVNLEDFFEQTVSPYRFSGTSFGEGPIYGLCKDWSPDFMVYYNKDLFDEAGISYPDGTWTWDEFVEISLALTKRDHRNRIIQFGVYNNALPEQWIRQAGGSLYSEDYLRCTLDSPEAIEGMRFAADLVRRWRVAPNLAEQAQGDVNVMFETGRVAMCFYGMWMTPQFQRSIQSFDWGVSMPPRGRYPMVLSAGMIGYGIFARTPHPNEAWRFFEYLEGRRGQEMLAREGWNLPAHRDVAYGSYFLGNPDHPQEVIEVFLDAVDHTEFIQLNPYISNYEFMLHFNPEWELVLLGEQSVEIAAAKVVRKVNQTIEDNRAMRGL